MKICVMDNKTLEDIANLYPVSVETLEQDIEILGFLYSMGFFSIQNLIDQYIILMEQTKPDQIQNFKIHWEEFTKTL